MYLKCVVGFESPSNGKVYRVGQLYDVADWRGQELLAEAAGGLVLMGEAPPEQAEGPKPEKAKAKKSTGTKRRRA